MESKTPLSNTRLIRYEEGDNPERCANTAHASGPLFDNQVLTVEEAASFLKLSSKTVYKYTRFGIIPHKKIGGEIRFLRSELIEFLKGE